MALEWVRESHNIVDIIHGVIPYSGLEAKIMDTPIFSRLQRILQSSLAYLTYPSNKVHRYEHSIGVMHLSGIFFYHSIINSHETDVAKLFEEIFTELKNDFDSDEHQKGLKKYLNSQAISDLKNDFERHIQPQNTQRLKSIDNTLYRSYTPSNLSSNQLYLYYATFEAVRLVGLLHDVGHLPYSHITEFALKNLYEEVISKDGKKSEKTNIFIKTMNDYFENNSNSQIHEIIGKKLVNKIFESIRETFPNTFSEECIFLACVFDITIKIIESSPGDNNIFSDIHRITDGVIDCDRMDYCCRDLYCAGISKEFPRYERLFYTVRLYYKTQIYNNEEDENGSSVRNRCNFSFNSKALGQIEMLLQRRLEDFITINYHHKVHKHELLLELVIVELGKESLSASSPNNDSDTSNMLSYDIAGIWETIAAIGGTGAVEILASQLDDEWLNTLLKYNFYNTYGSTYQSRIQNHNDIKWNRLDELITGQKHYNTLFKRTGGFGRFDTDFYEEYKKSENQEVDKKEGEYYFNIVYKLYKNKTDIRKEDFYKRIQNGIKGKIKDKSFSNIHIIDCIIAENNFSLGIHAKDMESIYIVSTQKNIDPVPLKVRTPILKNLDHQKQMFPPFHVYYLPEYDVAHNEYYQVNKSKLQKIIISIIINIFHDI